MVGPCSRVVGAQGVTLEGPRCGGMAGGYPCGPTAGKGAGAFGVFCVFQRTCKSDVLPVHTAFYSSMPSGVSLGVCCVLQLQQDLPRVPALWTVLAQAGAGCGSSCLWGPFATGDL